MKKIFLNIVLFSSILASCTNHTELFNSNAGNQTKVDITKVDADFTFNTRRDITVNITAINSFGNAPEGIAFSIFTENPYYTVDEESVRNRDVEPLYQGLTHAGGSATADIAVSTTVKTLYILPDFGGFGEMQTADISSASSVSITLKGLQFETSRSAIKIMSRAGNDIERDPIRLGNTSVFYTYFNDNEFKYQQGLSPYKIGNGVIASEEVSAAMLQEVNRLFPETENNYDGSAETIMKVEAEGGCEVWSTFLKEGCNESDHNSIAYYTYTDSDKPDGIYSAQYYNSDKYHLTELFPETSTKALIPGTRIQLLYYNKNTGKYQSKFPKGTYIGFAMICNGFKNNNYSFDYTSEKSSNPYCSNKAFNRDGSAHSVAFYSNQWGKYIVGFEKTGKNGTYLNVSWGDCDYNDALFLIDATPDEMSLTEKVEAVEDKFLTYDNQKGVLTFEDSWPLKGDYDFNDFVTKYTYTIAKNNDGKVVKIKMRFTPQAIGASYNNGFGIQLPVSTSNIESVEGATQESDESLATFIIYDNVRSAFDNATGFINTNSGGDKRIAAEKEITIRLAEPVGLESISFKKFNPFLFVNTRSHEIHLANYAPTSKMDKTLQNSGDDYTDASKGIYYRTDLNYPWCIDISDQNWIWPYENLAEGISKAYPLYDSWYKNWKEGKDMNWMSTANEQYLWK